MKSLYDLAFEAALGGLPAETDGLDHNESALYMQGYVEGERVRTLLEEN